MLGIINQSIESEIEMSFTAINELEHFGFQDAQIQRADYNNGILEFELEAVIVRANNSQNGNYTDSYAGTLLMRLENAVIQKGVKEGYKYYDANDVLKDEIPDTPLTDEQIKKLLKNSKDYYLFDMVKVNDEENTTGHFLYLLGIDADEETSYWLQVEFEKSVLSWERYMNRVQNM